MRNSIHAEADKPQLRKQLHKNHANLHASYMKNNSRIFKARKKRKKKNNEADIWTVHSPQNTFTYIMSRTITPKNAGDSK